MSPEAALLEDFRQHRADNREDFRRIFERLDTLDKQPCPCLDMVALKGRVEQLDRTEEQRVKREHALASRLFDLILRWGPLIVAALWGAKP